MRDRLRFESEVAALSEIFAPNTLTRVSDTTAAPFRWICHIETTLPWDDKPWTGTGLLIGPRHVLTSAHVIYPMKAGEVWPEQKVNKIVVYPGRHGTREPFGSFTANGWAVRRGWLQGRPNRKSEAHCAFDFGLIRLKENIAARRFSAIGNQPLGHWGLAAGTRFAAIDPATLNGIDLFTAGYPFRPSLVSATIASRVMQRSEGRALGALNLRRCTPESFEGQPPVIPIPPDARLLQHDVDTEKGQSGGPLWRNDGGVLTLVGVHYGELTPNRGPAFNAAVIVTQEVFNQINDWIRHFVE